MLPFPGTEVLHVGLTVRTVEGRGCLAGRREGSTLWDLQHEEEARAGLLRPESLGADGDSGKKEP